MRYLFHPQELIALDLVQIECDPMNHSLSQFNKPILKSRYDEGTSREDRVVYFLCVEISQKALQLLAPKVLLIFTEALVTLPGEMFVHLKKKSVSNRTQITAHRESGRPPPG